MDKDELKEIEETYSKLQGELKNIYEEGSFLMREDKELKDKLNEIDE
jgi:hypothetical protein